MIIEILIIIWNRLFLVFYQFGSGGKFLRRKWDPSFSNIFANQGAYSGKVGATGGQLGATRCFIYYTDMYPQEIYPQLPLFDPTMVQKFKAQILGSYFLEIWQRTPTDGTPLFLGDTDEMYFCTLSNCPQKPLGTGFKN